ncbi:11053_t:CDS:1, partial [Paraglomus brasilianum]
SKDGYRPSIFHNYCDNKGPTLAVIKVKGTEEIIGGYNPLNWNRSHQRHMHTRYSFLFALRSEQNGGNVFSTCTKTARAVNSNSAYGPSFGTSDLVITQGFSTLVNTAIQDAYSKPIRQDSHLFAVKEIEVFRIS